MSIFSGFSKFVTGFAVCGLLAFAQHGGGGGAHGGGGGFGGAHAGAGGMHASGGFHASPGVHGPSVSHGYPSGGAFPAGVTRSPYAASGGAFPAGVHSSPYVPLRSSPRFGTGAYPGIHNGHGAWRDGSRRGRLNYGVPFAYFAPYGYLGTPFYGDYDNGFVDSTPYDSGYGTGYNPGVPNGGDAYNGNVPPPYVEQQPYPEQAPYGPSARDPYAQYPIPLRVPDAQPAPTVSEPVPPSPPISLVLKNGETRQVPSYAIVGDTFWDLSSHPPRKIPLSSIDVEASTKATEAAGAEFPDIPGAH